MANNQFDRKTPRSLMCYWYRRGDMKRDPCVSIITKPGVNGQMNLASFGYQESRRHNHRGVRHKDDPWFDKHKDGLAEGGCWDYLPHEQPGAIPILIEEGNRDAKPKSAQGAEADEESGSPDAHPPLPEDFEVTDSHKRYIKDMLDRNIGTPEIASEMTTLTKYKWTHQRVTGVIRSVSK